MNGAVHVPPSQEDDSQMSLSSPPPAQAHAHPQIQMLMAHEAEIIIPGSFVVLQGNAGDGLSNTMDTFPVLEEPDDVDMQREHHDEDLEEFHHVENMVMQEEQDTTTTTVTSATATSATRSSVTVTPLTPPPITLGQLANRHSAATVTLNRFSTTCTVPTPPTAAKATTTTASDNDNANDDHYIVVTDDQESACALSTIPTISSQQQQQQQQQQQRSRPSPPRTTRPSFSSTCQDSQNTTTNHATNTAISNWQIDCRNRELQKRKEWRQARQLVPLEEDDNDEEEEDMWWQSQGRIALFRDVPTKLKGSGAILKSVLGTLDPGETIVATDIVYLDSNTLQRIAVNPTSTSTTATGTTSNTNTTTLPHKIYPRGKKGWIQMIKLEKNGRSVYAVLSLDGYPFLTPGVPSLHVDPHIWVWRVLCPAGAFVREGLDLYTQHIDTLPYGSLVRVTRKTVNNMGLSRLRVTAIVDGIGIGANNSPPKRLVDGWCSEFLNPLSGQRGMVAQPLAFPVPALYRVTLPSGAVIRSDVELSSRQIGHAPNGAILVIAGRAFSEHPMDKCIERLRLAGDGGWISVRLNRPPPQDDLVVELVGIDGTFEPDSPGSFHLEATKKVQASEMEPTAEESGRSESRISFGVDLSSIEDDSQGNASTTSSSGSNLGAATAAVTMVRRRATSTAAARHGGPNANETCLICLTEERNATIVHGETGHVACCLICARILKARGDKCPVCRLTIDSVIQQFWA
jgi:hypothetical protein